MTFIIINALKFEDYRIVMNSEILLTKMFSRKEAKHLVGSGVYMVQG